MKNITYTLVLCVFAFNLVGQNYQNISVTTANNLIQSRQNTPMFTILDVRTISEYNIDHLEDADQRNFYDSDFSLQLDSLDKCRTYLIYCQSGNRSGQAFTIMQNLGFKDVYNMLGGISSWRNTGFPTTAIVPQIDNIYRPQLRIDNNYLELLEENFDPFEFIMTGDFSSYTVELKDYSGNLITDYSSEIDPVTFNLSDPSGPMQLVISHQNQSDLSMTFMIE